MLVWGISMTMGVAALVLLAPVTAAAEETTDPYFGEALFYAHQGRYFDALERLDAELAQHRRVDERELDTLHLHVDDAEFSVGDFELSYRMHQRAGRAITAVLEADVPDVVRNDAAYRLARIHFHKGQDEDALRVLDGMRGEVPERIREEVAFLRANVLLSLDRDDEAVDVLREIQGSDDLRGFSTYNLGIAMLRAERPRDAIAQLDRAGKVRASDPETFAIRDQANLVLGTLLFEASSYDHAQKALDRVRLSGPFSNRALLGAGWADASATRYERALVPWGILAERDPTDPAVQEVLLALPYAYGQLEVHGRAAKLFERAVSTYGLELEKLDASIRSVREGRFLEALEREEARRDQSWVVRLRNLPEAPETFYLVELMASHDFQTALQNHLDLADLDQRLQSWQRSLDAFEELARLRRAYYEPILPQLDARFRELDAQIRLRMEQRDQLEERVADLLIDPSPRQLATGEERQLAENLDALEAKLDAADGPGREVVRARIDRLRGRLVWHLATSYHDRLTEVHEHLAELTTEVEAMQARYDSFVRARQAATHSYEGYVTRIRAIRSQVHDARSGCKQLMAKQGKTLERIAIRELVARRARVEDFQNQARFAFADSYDRAVKSQAQAH